MTAGANQTSKFGLVYTHTSNSMRRRAGLVVLAVFVLLALFYVPQSPVALINQTRVDIPASPKGAVISTAGSELDFLQSFPKKIWQSGSQSTRENWAEQTETWTSMNEDWNHEWLTDDTNTLFVEDSFQGRPALLTFWRDLNVPVLRAEFVRYLTMLAKGGVYSDVDTSCIKPIEEWIPSRFDDQIINAVIGIEYDDSTSNMFGRPVNFCQRTMMAKPRHPIFEAVVARVVYHFEYLARIQNTDLAGLEVEEKEVLEATGPGAFTDAVMESLSNAMGRKVEWSEIQDLQEPKLFGDVLILPINAFGSGQMHSHSSDPAYGDVLAQHQSGESWFYRPTEPGESAVASATEVTVEDANEVVLPVVESPEVPVAASEQLEELDVDFDESDSAGSEAIKTEAETQTDETPV